MQGQPLLATGNAYTFTGEGGEDDKPMAMPVPDSHANRKYQGRAGTLKANRPMKVGGNGAQARAGGRSVQRSKRRK